MSVPTIRERRRRFVLRTIRRGCVRINGVTFTPQPHDHPTSVPYAGQLDGQRWAFGLYYGPPNYQSYDASGWQRAFVSMWGNEAFYRSADAPWPGPNCINGYFQWEWWQSR